MDETDTKKRKRQKKLCKDIRAQMEFYFSDANLHKDRFLKQQINKSPDGWLNLDLFKNFNKLKKLTSDLDVVAKALSSSKLIQISDNGKKLRRKLPIAAPKDVDDRTVYVEFLPQGADHEWVKTTFSHYGTVVYVSLPKYRSSGDIKGFAFVEFETVEDANRACELMNNPPASESDHVGIFPVKGNKDVQRMQKILGTNQKSQQGKRGRRTRTVSETEVSRRQAEEVQEESKSRKRTRLWSQGSGDEDVDLSVKRLKTASDKKEEEDGDSSSSDSSSDEEPLPKKTKPDKTETEKSLKRKQDDSLEESPKKKVKIQIGSSDEDNKDFGEKKKRKKRKKKLKEDKKNIPELRVIPKKEWQTLRDEYIKLQKKNMSELKTSLKQLRNKEDESHDKENNMKTEEPMEHAEAGEKNVKNTNQLEFVAGVIVYLKSEGPLCRKNLKEELSKLGDIKYIDILDGDNTAYIRCGSAEVATEVSTALLDKKTATLLSDDEEKKYWDKILEDREKKLSSKSKPKKRGKDKAIGKVAQMKDEANKKSHIHFDDDS